MGQLLNFEQIKNNNVLYLTSDTVRVGDIKKKNEDIEGDYRVLIIVKNKIDGRIKPHPFTQILDECWPGSALATLKAKANFITPFLNYCLFERAEIWNIHSLSELTFDHLKEYLTEYRQKRELSTVLRCKNTLDKVYHYLAKKGYLKYISVDDFDYISSKNNKLLTPISRMTLRLGSAESSDNPYVLHDLPNELVLPFLTIALKKCPRIALGVFMQIYGGLRVADILNTTREAIVPIGDGEIGFVVNIKSRDMWPKRKMNTTNGRVKVPRYQKIEGGLGIVRRVYNNHIRKYQCKDATNALFVNTKGEAMTIECYRYYFQKLRREFILYLKASPNPSVREKGYDLEGLKWNTHLGRGIFSNLIAEAASCATELAVARGDRTLEAALGYVRNSMRTRNFIEKNQEGMYAEFFMDLMFATAEQNPIQNSK
ncbi:hypothetical protein [Petroclostridium sp. X23]|uniref:hypothetical protein n=1 Tax=Petroclostridium sp. X23 TaxID=3045146 RepID=UPI0024AD424B|nr:hypothetical protein [Petroclostridium sp. X23]WHH58844.1 hypothetical protein QKW49_24140 [Petroclostridium sp. X23]